MDYPRFNQKPSETKDLPNAPRLQRGRRAPAAHRQLRAPGSGLGGARREAHGAGVLGRLGGLRVEILRGLQNGERLAKGGFPHGFSKSWSVLTPHPIEIYIGIY